MTSANSLISEPQMQDLVRSDFGQTSAAANLAFNEKVKALIKSGRDVAHFAFGQSPFPIPDCFKEELKNYAHMNAYLPMKGIPELRKALSEFHFRYDDVRLDPENIIVGPGSKELIHLIMNVFNGVVFLTSPTWTTYETQAYLAGNLLSILPSNKDLGWKVTPEGILKGVEHLSSFSKKGYKLLVLTNPGNPTGTCYTEEELKDLSDCCRQNRILVLCDEIYSRLTFNRKHVSMVKFYLEGTIITNGFSKWASAGGWRLGYVYIPPSMSSVYDAVRCIASHTYSCAPAPMQYAVAKALVEHVNELAEYVDNCSTILKLVADYCHMELASVGVLGHKSEAGYYFMPDFEVIRNGMKKRGIVTGVQMTKAILEEADVALMASEVFLRPSSELSVRFCFVCFDGSQALRAYQANKKNGTNLQAWNEEGQEFLQSQCKTVVDGIQRLKDWVIKHKNQ